MQNKTKKVINSALPIDAGKIELQKKNSKIGELLVFAKKDEESEYKEINFGVIPNFQAQEINKNTGIKINGATNVLSNFAINTYLKDTVLEVIRKNEVKKPLMIKILN